MGPVSDYLINNRDLCSYRLIWAASPKLGFPKGIAPIARIAQEPIITYARNTRPYAELQSYLREVIDGPARIIPSSSLFACKRMAIDGAGVGMLPMACITDEVAGGELQVIPSSWHTSDLVFTASFPRAPDNLLTDQIATVAAVAADEFGQGAA